MTFTDIISHPSRLFQSFSKSDDLDKHQKLKLINSSTLNLSSRDQQSNTNEQQQTSFLQPPSDLSRSISHKSITFASVFDTLENETINHVNFNLESSQDTEDLIIIVPNKYVNNEPTGENTNTEPYPFRSEIPSCSLPKSHSGQKLFHQRRPKKHRHPIKSMHLNNTINRSTPNLLSTNDHHKSLKTVRQWFKSSSFGHFLPSFIKQKSRHQTTLLPKSSELIY